MSEVLLNAQILLASLTGTTALDLGPYTGEFNWDVMVDMDDMSNYANLGYAGIAPALVHGDVGTKGLADYGGTGISTAINASHAREAFAEGIIIGGVFATAGSAALFTRGLLKRWVSPTGKIGERAGHEMMLGVDNAPVDGFVGATLAQRTTSGLTGTAIQLGAVPASKRLWAALFVNAAAGTNLAVTIESDNAVGFPSAATALTFATVSAKGGQFLSVPGPITDDWFRVKATIASVTFDFACLFGVM